MNFCSYKERLPVAVFARSGETTSEYGATADDYKVTTSDRDCKLSTANCRHHRLL